MNIKDKKRYGSNTIDFLVTNLIIIIMFNYRDAVLEFLVPNDTLHFMEMPKFYAPFIEGLMAGVLISVYILLKKRISILFILLGLWLYPVLKYTLHIQLNGLEDWLVYLSELSMFLGAFGVFCCSSSFYVSYLLKQKMSDNLKAQ